MRKLLKFLKPYRKESILAPLFKLLEAGFELLVPLIMAGIIDYGIDGTDRGYIWRMGFWLLLLGVVGLICSITAQFFAARAAVGFAKGLRQHLFDHLLGLTYTDIDRFGASAMITRMTSDINQVQNGVNMVLRLFLRSPVVVFGAAIMAFTIDVKSALVFVVAIPALVVVICGLLWLTIPMYRKVQGALDRVLALTRENLTGVRVIRAFHKEEAEKEEFTGRNTEYLRQQVLVGKISAFLNPVTFIIINGALAVLIYVGGVQVNIGNLTQGEVVALINYMSQILVELIKLANLIVTMTKALACADRVAAALEYGENIVTLQENLQTLESQHVIESKKLTELQSVTEQKLSNDIAELSASRTDKPETHTQFSITKKDVSDQLPYITFDHVSFTYQGAGDASLKDVNFHVMEGQTIGIIGGTGSGKSTLVNLIPRFYEVTEGTIRLMGKDIRQHVIDHLRSKIGIVPQKAALFRGTIRSNLAMGNEEAGDDAMWAALEAAQGREVAEGKKGGLDAKVTAGGRNFSGGQKQRLTIARALVRKPDILILDDSASALDYATDAKLRGALSQIHNKATFIISQRSSSLRHADQIIVLDNGEMAGIGTHDELLRSCKVYQEICSFEGVKAHAASQVQTT
jgi:ABC-type multidrug transport system fused ATPase/permease subunit